MSATTRVRPVDALPTAAAYVDGDGLVLAVNDAFRDLWTLAGAGGGPIEGRPLVDLFTPGDGDAVREAMAGARSAGQPRSRAATLARSPLAAIVEFTAITRDDGSFMWLTTIRPSQEASSLDEAEKARAAVIAGLVHDLRAPIQTMLGWASLLRRKHDPERLEHALTIIERNARLQIALLEDLQALTRPSWTHSPLHRQHVDLHALVESELLALEPLAQTRGVKMSIAVDAPGIAVEANEVHLRRVVGNLVGNALKFTPGGGSVICRLYRSGHLACFAVRDSGRGILREFLPNVFDPFWQEPDGGRGKGHGLGLSVVRHLVEINGGTVRAESDGRGRGATFTVLLPAHAAMSAVGRRVSSLVFGA